MKRLLGLLALLPLAACPTEPEEEAGTVLTATFSVPLVESSHHQGNAVQDCVDTFTLAGTITIVVREAAGNTLDGEGRINATQTHVSTTGSPGCNPIGNRSTGGDMSTDLTGTPAQAGFIIERVSTNAVTYTSRFTFAGTVTPTSAAGTLTFTLSSQGTINGVQSTSNGSATVNVTLH